MRHPVGFVQPGNNVEIKTPAVSVTIGRNSDRNAHKIFHLMSKKTLNLNAEFAFVHGNTHFAVLMPQRSVIISNIFDSLPFRGKR